MGSKILLIKLRAIKIILFSKWFLAVNESGACVASYPENDKAMTFIKTLGTAYKESVKKGSKDA